MTINYSIDYQYLPKGRERPLDDGSVVDLRVPNDAPGQNFVPNVGDFVHVGKSDEHAHFSGRVRSRAFFYQRTGQTDIHCHVNIVVEETDDDEWASLIKE
jgi:hypothetical protein